MHDKYNALGEVVSGEGDPVEVLFPGWSPEKTIPIPRAILEGAGVDLQPGAHFSALINLGTDDVSGLEPDVVEGVTVTDEEINAMWDE